MSLSLRAARMAAQGVRPHQGLYRAAQSIAAAVRRHPGGTACTVGGVGLGAAPFASETASRLLLDSPVMLEKLGMAVTPGNQALQFTTLAGLAGGLVVQGFRRFADYPLTTVRDGLKSHAMTTLQAGVGVTLMAVAASAPMEQIAAVPGMMLLTHVLTKTGEMGRSLLKKAPKV